MKLKQTNSIYIVVGDAKDSGCRGDFFCIWVSTEFEFGI